MVITKSRRVEAKREPRNLTDTYGESGWRKDEDLAQSQHYEKTKNTKREIYE